MPGAAGDYQPPGPAASSGSDPGSRAARTAGDRPPRVWPVTPDQWRTLREVRLAALADAPEAFGSTLERELGYDERRWREWISSSACFLAWRDYQPAGIAAGRPDDPSWDYSVPGSWHLLSMWVAPGGRGRGVAELLVASVTASARQAGAGRLVLWVTDVNARAQAFYARLGFRATGRRQQVRPEQPGHWEQEQVLDLGGT